MSKLSATPLVAGFAVVATAAGLGATGGWAGTEAAAVAASTNRSGSQDSRTMITMPPEAREAVLTEMRQMLEALNGVLLAAARQDREGMAEAARSGGTAIAVDTDPEVARALPDEFVRLGSGTHRQFDALAEAIEGGIDTDSVVARLGSLTAKCVACHASYRVVTPEER